MKEEASAKDAEIKEMEKDSVPTVTETVVSTKKSTVKKAVKEMDDALKAAAGAVDIFSGKKDVKFVPSKPVSDVPKMEHAIGALSSGISSKDTSSYLSTLLPKVEEVGKSKNVTKEIANYDEAIQATM